MSHNGKQIEIVMGDIVRQHEAPPMAQKLLQRLQDHIDRLRPYRHSAIQKARKRSPLYDLFKALCPVCDFTVPMLKAYFRYGSPIRPRDKLAMIAVGDWGE